MFACSAFHKDRTNHQISFRPLLRSVARTYIAMHCSDPAGNLIIHIHELYMFDHCLRFPAFMTH